MGMGLIRSAARNKKITIFLIITIIILGLYSYYIVPKQENPEIESPVAHVITVYPGASPEEVENRVTKKIEDEVVEISGFDYSQSFSKSGISVVLVFLEVGADTEEAWDDLRINIDDVQKDLPEGCHESEINTELAETAGFIFSFSGEKFSYEELENYAEFFRDNLSSINGISKFDIEGVQNREVVIKVDTENLNHYDLSLKDVSDIVQAQNEKIPSGVIKNEERHIRVETPAHYKSLSDIENTVINVSPDGVVSRLKDTAEVFWDYEEPEYKTMHNGKDAVLLTGYFQDDQNIVLVGDEILKEVENLKKEIPPDLEVSKVLFQPDDVQDSISQFMISLLIGMAMVTFVVFVGIGLRNALIASVGIPLSILITFIAMNLLGIDIDKISIAGLIIALGILVDNAIVVSDAIQVRLDEDEERLEACVNGAKEMGVPIFTSTLVAAAAFSPLLLVPGVAGEYLESLPLVVIISLLASFAVAMLVIPAIACLFFLKTPEKRKRTGLARKAFNYLLRLSLNKKKIAIGLVLIIFGASIYLASLPGLEFFPKADTDMMYIDVETETPSGIEETERLTKDIEEILLEQKEIVSCTSAVGGGLPRFFITLPPAVQAEDFSQIKIAVDLEKSDRFTTNEEFADFLQRKIDSSLVGGTATVRELEEAEPREAPIQIRVLGENIEQLIATADNIKELLREKPGTINISCDSEEEIYNYEVDVDVDKASSMGFSNYDIQSQIFIALEGTSPTVFTKNGEEYDINIKSTITSKRELENLAIKSSETGNKSLLKQFAEIKLDSQRPAINRYDRERVVTVTSDVRPGYNPVEIAGEMERKTAEMDLGEARLVFDGEKEQIEDNFGNLGINALFALFVIYIILLFQFNSFTQPLIILLTVPLSLIGSIIGLLIFSQPLSFTAFLGVVSLMGLVIKNAILLIEHVNQNKDRVSLEEACILAMNRRFRPIILSAVTTAAGLLPLALSGSPLFVPMAVSLMCGLLVSTFLTLIIIPVVIRSVPFQEK